MSKFKIQKMARAAWRQMIPENDVTQNNNTTRFFRQDA
jgi:hypothetical protein